MVITGTTVALTIYGATMLQRLLAPVAKAGWKYITKAEKKDNDRILAGEERELERKIYLQRENHEQRLQEARAAHKLAMEKWKTQWKTQVYYERCYPLRNPFDMMICEPISEDKTYFKDVIVPCRIISALKDTDHPYATTINGNLSSFLVNYYPANSIHSVVSEIGAWKNEIPSNDASINYLYAGLKKQPVMILAPTLINDGKTFIFKVWSWGLGEDLNYPAGFEFGRLEMQPLWLQCVYEETCAMIQLANEMEYDYKKVYSADLLHNISFVKQIQEKKLTGNYKWQMLSYLKGTPEINDNVKKKMETKISGVFCCMAGMYADAYHLLEYKTLPKLPSLLPHIPFVEFMIPSLKNYYCELLETLEQIEDDKMLLANLYLDVADSFSKLPFSFENQEDIVIPFVQKALGRYIQEKDSEYATNNEKTLELEDISSVKAIIQIDYKYDDFTQRANRILEQAKISPIC